MKFQLNIGNKGNSCRKIMFAVFSTVKVNKTFYKLFWWFSNVTKMNSLLKTGKYIYRLKKTKIVLCNKANLLKAKNIFITSIHYKTNITNNV